MSEIAVGTDRIRSAFDLPAPAFAVAFTPDGRTAYVGCGNEIIPIDVGTGRAGTPIALPPLTGAHGPQTLAMSPDGRTLYMAGGTDTVTPIDTVTNRVGRPITVGLEPMSIGISKTHRTAVVVDAEAGVTPIDTATEQPGRVIPTGAAPTFVAISPDGGLAYIGGGFSVPSENPGTWIGNGTAAVDAALAANAMAVIDVARRVRVGSISVDGGYAPVTAFVLTANGKSAYAIAYNMLFPVDTATRKAGGAMSISLVQAVAIVP